MVLKQITKKEMAVLAKKIKDLAQGEDRPIEGVMVAVCPGPHGSNVKKGITVSINLIADTATCKLCGVEMNVKTFIRKWEEGND